MSVKNLTEAEVVTINSILATEKYDDLHYHRRVVTKGGANVDWLRKHLPAKPNLDDDLLHLLQIDINKYVTRHRPIEEFIREACANCPTCTCKNGT